MDMQNKKVIDYHVPSEVEIDLVDFLKRLLLQWKAVVIFAMVCAALIAGGFYYKSVLTGRILRHSRR